MINNDKKCMCESCEHARFRAVIDKDGKEIKAYDCPYSDIHTYEITECSNYSHPGGFQKLLKNKFLVFCFTAIILGLIVMGIVAMLK